MLLLFWCCLPGFGTFGELPSPPGGPSSPWRRGGPLLPPLPALARRLCAAAGLAERTAAAPGEAAAVRPLCGRPSEDVSKDRG